ncbi:AAA family ATPase [Mobilitalea sibirica]|uniref:AAA family ATPase n=1 Tax=Mobilitalea sibirica TaxID=1462919 RepID=A0A8J7KZV8_9FIRM|nr:AAA family ATPase [Mobilitalea sibirica]MBH1941058.1 AAA family ATPase [Mobilitalea sibirica]
MYISKVIIHNFKCYRDFEIILKEGLNILVGDNEAGKSTILEAINLALTGLINGKSIWNELTQYLFNKEVVDEYLASLMTSTTKELPFIMIEVYFGGEEVPLMNGDANSDKDNSAEGFSFKIAFNDKYSDEYEALIKQADLKSLPIEYYDITWTTFARDSITIRSIPYKSSLIDSSECRYQSGNDLYLSRIIKGNLEPEDITSIAQAHRKMRDSFMCEPSIETINKKINQSTSLTEKKITLSVELVTKNAWENSLVTQLDEIPFNYIGKGEQCVVKTELAFAKKTAKNAGIILLEEPENHLSHTRLNQLIKCISDQYSEKQILISTHNSFVANKLGLENLYLLDNMKVIRFSELSVKTYDFFRKIAGYDTLRLILCKRAILCEGDSDELVIQKAYMQLNEGKLPIQDGVEVISVGISFLRFLELADCLKKNIVVVTDNDGDIDAIDKKYSNYLGQNSKDYVKICVDRCVDSGNLLIGNSYYNYNTLEPKLLKVNGLEKLNRIFETNYTDEDELRKYMKHNKTECSLKIFESTEIVEMPEYILEAIR